MNFESFHFRRSSFPFRKKSVIKAATQKSAAKKSDYQHPASKSAAKKSEFQLKTDNLPVSKSSIFQGRHLSPENVVRNRYVNILAQYPEDDLPQGISRSLNDLVKDASKDDEFRSKDSVNSSGGSDITNDVAGGVAEGGESSKKRSAIEGFQHKIAQTMEQIRNEQFQKEANVNEYLQLAMEADKQQLLRMKQLFEKKNQKSTIVLSTLQKKIEKYNKSIIDLESVSSHKVTKDKLKDMSQNLKDVGSNIVEGITGFSGGVVDNIKGVTESFVSKPREIATLIKNRFGSTDNISSLSKLPDELIEDEFTSDGEIKTGDGKLPASFKFGSEEEEKSSMSSGSGFGHQASGHSSSLVITSKLVTISQPSLDLLVQQIHEYKENGVQLQEQIGQLTEDFETYKFRCQQELSLLRSTIDENKFKIDRMEEQMNDINELRQQEVINIRQDIASMEEKIEYRLDERTADISDLLENCQTRVTKMELQQQQQQVVSMEMVDNVKFRTVLSKLLNVILALLAVVLVFVSTFANLLAPFLTNRARILSTAILITSVILSWKHWTCICDYISNLLEYYILCFHIDK